MKSLVLSTSQLLAFEISICISAKPSKFGFDLERMLQVIRFTLLFSQRRNNHLGASCNQPLISMFEKSICQKSQPSVLSKVSELRFKKTAARQKHCSGRGQRYRAVSPDHQDSELAFPESTQKRLCFRQALAWCLSEIQGPDHGLP